MSDGHSFSEFKLASLTYFEQRVHVASFLAMKEWLFAKWCRNQHICFAGLNHCLLYSSNLRLAWWPEKAYFLFLFSCIEGFFFFLPSKRSIMTSTCPPLPLPHSLREVCFLNTHADPIVQCACLCQVLQREALMFCGKKHHSSGRGIDCCTLVCQVTSEDEYSTSSQ